MEKQTVKPPTGFYRNLFAAKGYPTYRVAFANQPITNARILPLNEVNQIVAILIEAGIDLPEGHIEREWYKWYAEELCKKTLLLIKPMEGETYNPYFRTGELYFKS